MRNKIALLLLSFFILTINSCGLIDIMSESEPNPEVKLNVTHMGYSHVDFNVQLQDIVNNSSHKEITIYYDKTNYVTTSSPSPTKSYNNDEFNIALTGLEMGQDYFAKIFTGQANSAIIYVTTQSTTFNCSIAVGYLMGNNSVTRQWYSNSSISTNLYLEHINFDHLSSGLQGDFSKIEFIIPEPGAFYEGAITTYNPDDENGISPSQGTSQVRLTDNDGNIYNAVAAQAFEYIEFGGSSHFYITFCDLLFVNDSGATVTLSAKLEGRYKPS